MSDTNLVQFSMRERMFLSTPAFVPKKSTQPGKVYRVCADPIGSIIRSETPQHGLPMVYASPLALTLSRFRDFRYVGTRVALVPAASTAQIDPAHISTTAGTNNYMHPRDVSNCIHWRRWMGGNFRIPSLSATDPTGYSETDAYMLDAAWLSDERFNHVSVGDGFEFFSEPFRANVETSAAGTNSLFGFRDILFAGGERKWNHGLAEAVPILDPARGVGALGSEGAMVLSGGSVHPDTWVPNPFAGFMYSMDGGTKIGEDKQAYHVSGINERFPWFSDTGVIRIGDDSAMDFTLAEFYNLVRERFMAPLCILRLPSAYGSPFYWTLYFRHYFAVRKPFLVNGTWSVGLVSTMYDQVPDGLGAPDDGRNPIQYLIAKPADEPVIQMISPDPYAAADSDGGQDVICLSDDPYAPRMPVYSYLDTSAIVTPSSTPSIPTDAPPIGGGRRQPGG